MNFLAQMFDAGRTAPDSAVRVLGIDLGTTNSVVCEAVWPAGSRAPELPRCLNIEQPTTQGLYTHFLVPSVVALHDNQIWVGEGAKRLRAAPGMGEQEYALWFAETKNDMGIKRTYHRAPAHLRSARAIASEILKFLYEAAKKDAQLAADRVVITVPASFQIPQREDTVAAAQRAHIPFRDGDLLDEPVAAFLAYLARAGEDFEKLLPPPGRVRNLLVFDFGGGTCDVAVFRLERQAAGLRAAPVTVSRYHRLGGGDIDRAIIHEVLLAQLLGQNGMQTHELEFEDKRQRLQPALLSVAEALKQKLSNEIARLKKLGRWDRIERSEVVEQMPGTYQVSLKDRTIALRSPRLNAEEFERVLEPFLERDLLQPTEDEYRITCSIFAPIVDALERGRLAPENIDLCLLVGGSSLIPQVAEAVSEYFRKARTLAFPDREAVQTAVAEGAALHALSLAVLGRPLVEPVCHDDILFRTRKGPIVLVAAGTSLPFPASGGYARNDDLTIPESVAAGRNGEIRVEVLAGAEERLLFGDIWTIPGPARKGDPLELNYRLDQNQVLELRLRRPGEERAFEKTVENPLTHVVNPGETRRRMMELEEQLRTGAIPREEMGEAFEQLGDLCRELGQCEKALAYYGRALRLSESSPAYLLNRMALCADEMGDRRRAERYFEEAARRDPWSGTYFNWALVKESWGQRAEALELAEKALQYRAEPAYQALKARLLARNGDIESGRRLAAEALRAFGAPEALDDFELHWFKVAAQLAGDQKRAAQAEELIRQEAGRNGKVEPPPGGELPDLRTRPGD